MATVTFPVKVATTVPVESNAVTCTGGMVLSFIVLRGWVVKVSRFFVDPAGGACVLPEVWNSLSK